VVKVTDSWFRPVWLDQALAVAPSLTPHAAILGIGMEIVTGTPGARGFTPIPKRWTVERT
jgi:hypothetical protein